jgi:deoxyribonuclease V
MLSFVKAHVTLLAPPVRGPDGRWDLRPAKALQDRLRQAVLVEGSRSGVRHVGGADVSYGRGEERARAAVVVLEVKTLRTVDSAIWEGPVSFPYVPGYLSFREAPAVIEAWRRLRIVPDLLLVDGHGIAHPRRFGLASHLGLLLDVPTIGVAKSVLVGEATSPGRKRGSRSSLTHRGERIGTVLRTRDGVSPVFVSVGHKISLPTAERWVLRCGGGFRLPEPTRRADRLVASRA